MLSLGHAQRGVTLVELMIGFALVGILAVLAVPTYQHWIQNTQIRNAAEALVNGMQIARAEAIRRNAAVELALNGGSGWTVSTVLNPVVVQQRDAQEGSRNAAVTVTPTGANRLSFNGMGWVIGNADGSASITRIDVSSATMTGPEIRPLRVIVTMGGITKMCDPATTLPTGDPRKCP